MNYSKLSLTELKKAKAQIEKAIAQKEKADVAVATREVQKILAKRGLTVQDLLAKTPASTTKKAPVARKKPSAKVKPKYANPNDAKVTWTGRGRQPLWVQSHIAKGGKLEDLTIG